MNKRIFFVLYLTVFATIFGLGIIGPVMPIYADSLGASGIWLGIIFAAFSISRGIFMPIVGKISDERGRKKFILFGLAAYFVISILYPMASNVWSLTAVRLVHGVTSAIVIPIAMAYVGEISLIGHEGRAMGTINQAMFLGMGGGPLLGGILYQVFGFSAVFYPLSALSGLSFFLILFFLPEKKGLSMPRGSVSYRKILKNKLLMGLMIFRIINALGRGGVMSFIPIYASRSGLSTARIGVMVAVPILLMAILQSPFGLLSDKSNKFYLVLAGSAIGSLGLVLIPASNGFWQLVGLLVIMALGGAISMPAATALAVIAGKDLGLGATMGMFNTAMSIGMMAAPLISGVIMDAWGLNSIFYVAGGISIIGLLFFVYYFRLGLAGLKDG